MKKLLFFSFCALLVAKQTSIHGMKTIPACCVCVYGNEKKVGARFQLTPEKPCSISSCPSSDLGAVVDARLYPNHTC